MTLEKIFTSFNQQGTLLALILLLLPWVIWILCDLIPGSHEEPFLLSLAIGVELAATTGWAGYLAYATHEGGWKSVVQEANGLLLIVPPLSLILSIWVARQRLPLDKIPAIRTLQGLAILIGVYLILAWLGSRVRIVFFSYMPFSAFLWILAGLLLIGYLGYRRIMNE
jgi:hypothetical protein